VEAIAVDSEDESAGGLPRVPLAACQPVLISAFMVDRSLHVAAETSNTQ